MKGVKMKGYGKEKVIEMNFGEMKRMKKMKKAKAKAKAKGLICTEGVGKGEGVCIREMIIPWRLTVLIVLNCFRVVASALFIILAI